MNVEEVFKKIGQHPSVRYLIGQIGETCNSSFQDCEFESHIGCGDYLKK